MISEATRPHRGLKWARNGALALACMTGMFACERERERELAGAAEHIDDEVYLEVQAPKTEPLYVDVHADAIYVQTGGALQVVRRGDDRHHTLQLGTDDTQLIAVPGRDDLLVWTQPIEHADVDHANEDRSDERRVIAARTVALAERWTLFDYPVDDAVRPPVVVGDQVALLTTQGIVHASLDGDGVGVLPLTLRPEPPLVHYDFQPLTAQAGHLVWIARDGDHDFVVSSDASFEAAVIEYEEHEAATRLVAAAKFADSLVIVALEAGKGEREDQLPTLIIQRHRPTTGPVELWRRPFNEERLKLLSDGEQSWLVFDNELWRISPNGHAPVPEFMPSAGVSPDSFAIDDGLLLWTTLEQGWLRHHASTGVSDPLRVEPLPLPVMNDDADVWGSLTAANLGSYATNYPVLPAQPRPRVRQGKLELGPGLDRDIVRRIARAHINEVRHCYNLGLHEQPELSGTVEIEFVIGADGRVRKTKDVTGARLASRDVRRCVAAAVRRWNFPKPKSGKQVTVSYPFTLAPS